MKTTYLLFKPGVCASVIERYVLHLKDSVKWVDSLEDATADYLPAIEATQERLKTELGLETRLVEIPDELGGSSQWVISKED
jgi:hypothetical protein